MTSRRQQKKKAAKLAAKNAEKQTEASAAEGAEEAEEVVEEAASPEQQQTSQFAKEGLAGIAPEGSDIKELPLETANPASTTDDEKPKDKKPEDLKKPAEQEEETPEQKTARRKKCAGSLSEAWEIHHIDPLLEEELSEVNKKKDRRYGEVVEMVLKSGHKVGYYNNFAGQGYEFIGIPGQKSGPLDDDDARAVVAAAKSKGWNRIKLHGSKEDKDKLWLEAQRQGVETTYTPPEGSAVLAQWKKEYDSAVDKNAAGVRQDTDPAPEETAAPAAATAKTETAPPPAKAETATAPETDVPGMTTKDAAANSRFTSGSAEKKEEPKEEKAQTFSEYLQEKIEKAKNANVAEGLKKIKEAHENGELKLGINQTFMFKNELEKKGYDAAAKFAEEASNPLRKAGEGITLPREKGAQKQQKQQKHQHARR